MKMELLISPEEIQKKITEHAHLIDQEYQGRELTIVMVMKGALCLVADLIRSIQVPCQVEFVQASSYGARGMQRGELTISGLDKIECRGKDLLIVDDIFDSGQTLLQLSAAFQNKQPSSIKTFVLLHKQVQREHQSRPDWTLFEIEDYFVVGYGLDYQEHFRGLPGIYRVYT